VYHRAVTAYVAHVQATRSIRSSKLDRRHIIGPDLNKGSNVKIAALMSKHSPDDSQPVLLVVLIWCTKKHLLY